ncbi:MAG: ATPase domain-containing protein [Candidatus Micrarchaeota archaeon]
MSDKNEKEKSEFSEAKGAGEESAKAEHKKSKESKAEKERELSDQFATKSQKVHFSQSEKSEREKSIRKLLEAMAAKFESRKESAKVKSGIKGLDEIIEGGLPRGSVVTISGGTGCGKTTFGVQFLYFGATKQNEPGLCISFDEHKTMMFRNMKRYGWDLEKLEDEKKFLFIEYPPYEIEHFVSQETMIHDLIREMGVRRLVIDSITPVALTFEDEQKRRMGLLKLIEKIRRWDCTTLLISETVEETPKTKFGIEFLSDGLIHIGYMQVKGCRERTLEVVKLRGVIHGCETYLMKLASDGISVHKM